MCGYGQGTEYLKWEMEQDGFISHYIYQEVPPKVEYSLTDLGKSFIPIYYNVFMVNIPYSQ